MSNYETIREALREYVGDGDGEDERIMSEYVRGVREKAVYEYLRDKEIPAVRILNAGDVKPFMDKTIREAKAEAWNEGWDRAYEMARGWGHVDGWPGPWPTNPYEGVH